nr:energy-coupling factor transporter transmembrane component T [Promineifilum sp.]
PASDQTILMPGALHELAAVMLIAIKYTPETPRQFRRIRDAQAIRGHRISGLRDWRPIVIPLMIAGLERALNLSETMVARGYGSTVYVATPLRARLLMLAGLMFTLGGALQLLWGKGNGRLLLVVGIAAIGLTYLYQSRLIKRTQYRPRRWRPSDTLFVAGSFLPLLLYLPSFRVAATTLVYSVYPELAPPPFNLFAGVVLIGLATPAIVAVAIRATAGELE